MGTRPVLVYDGDCAFCTSCVHVLERWVRPDADVVPHQLVDLAALDGGRGEVTVQRAQHEVLWVTPAGEVYGGAPAIAKALLSAGRGWAVPGAVLMLPLVRAVAKRVYRVIADNRERMPGATPACSVSGVPGHLRVTFSHEVPPSPEG